MMNIELYLMGNVVYQIAWALFHPFCKISLFEFEWHCIQNQYFCSDLIFGRYDNI